MLFAMEPDLQNHFEEFAGPFEILEEPCFRLRPVLTDMRSLRSSLTARWRKGVPLVRTPLRCRATLNVLSNWTARFQKSSIDRVLQSLPPSYKGFVVTHNQIGST